MHGCCNTPLHFSARGKRKLSSLRRRALPPTSLPLRLQNIHPRDLNPDLAVLMSLYQQELNERSLADFPMLLQLAAEEAGRGAHRILNLPLVLLDVAVESQSHEKLLASVIAKSPVVLATAISGDDRAIESLTSLLGTAVEEI